MRTAIDSAVGQLDVQCDQESVRVGDHDDPHGQTCVEHADLGHSSLFQSRTRAWRVATHAAHQPRIPGHRSSTAPAADPPGGTVVPRSCSAARQCHWAGWRRFHRHAHRRVTPHGVPLVPSSRTVPKHGRVLTRPNTSAAPDRRCAMCPRRPSCPRLTARRATPPTPPPSHPRQGPRLAQFRRGRWSARFRRITTSKYGDWARRRPPSGHPRRPPGGVHARGPAMASRARRLGRLVRRRRGHHYPRPVVSPGLALPGRYRAGGAGLGQPLPAGRGRRPRRCGPWACSLPAGPASC